MAEFRTSDSRPLEHSLLSPHGHPQLLVSVRNGEEARLAIAGGCDILDVKEPSRGSLGMADLDQIAEVLHVARSNRRGLCVSIALGEANEWTSERPVPPLDQSGGIGDRTYFKLGTAGLAGDRNWAAHWAAARQRLAGSVDPQWIIVGYSDSGPANAPNIDEIIAAADDQGCAGVLIDTFSKSAGGLFSWLPVDQLVQSAVDAQRRGLLFAVAGRLQLEDLPLVVTIGTDIVGIRSAACRERQRNGPLCSDAVRRFRAALQTAAARR